jgi:hypothetical protein
MECSDRRRRLENLESLQAKYEQMNQELNREIVSLRETIEGLHRQLSMQTPNNDELNRSSMLLSKQPSQSKESNALLLSTVSRRNIQTKESGGLAQELLQKNIALEESNKRLKYKISQLNKELYDNEKVFGTRLELVYTALRNYI